MPFVPLLSSTGPPFPIQPLEVLPCKNVEHIYPGTIGEELWHEEIASGEAILAETPGPPGVNWDQLCTSCGNIWTAR